MVERILSDQLDNIVEAIIAKADGPQPPVDQGLAPLVRIAVELRGLPRESFKARLSHDLKRRTSMATTATAVKPIREGFHTVTPYISVTESEELIDFLKQAFGAEELLRVAGSPGAIHAELRIGNSMVMIGGGQAKRGTPNLSAFHLYVENADAVYHRSLEAGATSIEAPLDEPHLGDRLGAVKDPSGNQWYIATNKATGGAPAGLNTITTYLHPPGAAQMIDFLERAFGAEERFKAQSPAGFVHYARIKIGDSMIELSDPHGEYQPLPTMLYLYVEDVDAWYKRAMAAGALSLGEPADQPYGDRTAAVTDSFGHTWYLATHIKDL